MKIELTKQEIDAAIRCYAAAKHGRHVNSLQLYYHVSVEDGEVNRAKSGVTKAVIELGDPVTPEQKGIPISEAPKAKAVRKYKVILQYWEESERGWGVRPDGASLHLNEECRKAYIQKVFDAQNDLNEYERPSGLGKLHSVTHAQYQRIKQAGGSLRLWRSGLKEWGL